MTVVPSSEQPNRRPAEGRDAVGHETFEPPASPSDAGRRRTKRGSIWRGTKLVLGAPIAALTLGQIVQNGRLIQGLVSDLRRGPPPPRPVSRDLDGKLDFSATALAYGLSKRELDECLARRQGQTATMAYVAFGLGLAFVGLWFWRLLELDGMGQRLLTGLQFAPFCLVFFLAAFQQAHINWQLRTGRLGSVGDYLRSTEPFWPCK